MVTSEPLNMDKYENHPVLISHFTFKVFCTQGLTLSTKTQYSYANITSIKLWMVIWVIKKAEHKKHTHF
jgi:hypothetical protein